MGAVTAVPVDIPLSALINAVLLVRIRARRVLCSDSMMHVPGCFILLLGAILPRCCRSGLNVIRASAAILPGFRQDAVRCFDATLSRCSLSGRNAIRTNDTKMGCARLACKNAKSALKGANLTVCQN
eukprot:CAMPEP_0115854506 /NCGR_PEP_ID=MMETSP0287-20121206/14060_1 /TAXON_ID=412157 /ORGANISM="Chrysochromulina rotalis, Strain UIO044" /LENGTH=126 /DNA_ID=CAMNT_0003308627 /DNA_START=21 /DNA_END=401 /DNA_ORIENTATION=+